MKPNHLDSSPVEAAAQVCGQAGGEAKQRHEYLQPSGVY